MNILFFAKNFYTNNQVSGGMEHYLYNLILHLKKRHKIILFIPNKYNISIPNVTIYNFHEMNLPYISFLSTFISIFIQLPLILLKEKPNIISGFNTSFEAAVVFLISKIFGIKTILNLRGTWDKSEKIMILLGSLAFFFTDYITVNANELKEKYLDIIYYPKTKFRNIKSFYMPNGINSVFWRTDNSNVREKEYDIVFVANIHDHIRYIQKGFETLYKTIEYFNKTYNFQIKTEIIGSFNHSLIKSRIPNFSYSNFTIQGSILKKTDLKKLMQSAKIFILSSNAEGMPNSLMEALAIGIPSIATDVGAVKKLIKNGYNGYIVQKGDYKILSEKIFELLNDEEKRGLFSNRSRNFIEKNFDWNQIINILERMYQSVLK